MPAKTGRWKNTRTNTINKRWDGSRWIDAEKPPLETLPLQDWQIRGGKIFKIKHQKVFRGGDVDH